MSSPKLTAQPRVFDPSKLDVMNEPLFVRVEKVKGGSARTPIPLPPGEDGAQQGTGWSKDDVRGLEMWIVNEWSGGGHYMITVSDSSLPTPLKHDWAMFYDPRQYPEKVPPTLSAAAASDPSSSPQQVRQMGSFPSAFPNGLPGGGITQAPGQPTTVYVPQPSYYQQPQQPIYREPPRAEYHQAQAAMAAAAAAETERRRYEDQLKEMQAQLARAREEQLQAQHRQELERVEARMRAEALTQNEKFSKLEQLIASLATTAQRPAVDPAIEALKEQNRVLAAAAADERREREAERREREMKDMIQRQAEESRRQIEAMNAQLAAAQIAQAQAAQAAQAQAALAAATQNKPDHMIMFLQENSRQQVEAVKEQARNQTAQMAQMQAYMMNPRDVMAMAKESSNGLDQATRSITSTYQSILEMQRNAVEQILQLNQNGGSETIQLIEKGLDRASSFAERFIGGKTKEAVSAQQSQAQLAQANAAAMQAQAQAMTVQAAMQQRAAQQAQSGLNGIPATAGPNGETRVSQTSSAGGPQPAPAGPSARDGWTTGPVPPAVAPPIVKRVLGRTDEEWFGPILPRVIELRAGVARFIESISLVPPRLNEDGSVDGVEPEQAADAILQAAAIVMQQQIPIPSMIELLGQGRVADFMDVLIPESPQPYRDEVAQLTLHALQGGSPDDDDDEEDEDEDDGDDSKLEAAKPDISPKPAKPAPRAPARA